MVGRSGCGKSTLINKIVGEDVIKVPRIISVDNLTTPPVNKTLLINNNLYNCHITGLTSDQLSKKKVLQMNLGKVKLIIHVVRYGRLTAEECDIFQVCIDVFKNTQSVSALVFTNCDFKSEESRISIVNEIISNDLTKDFAAIMGKGIYTVGFYDLGDFANHAGFKEHLELQQEIDLAQLHRLIEESSDAVDVLKSSDDSECSVL